MIYGLLLYGKSLLFKIERYFEGSKKEFRQQVWGSAILQYW